MFPQKATLARICQNKSENIMIAFSSEEGTSHGQQWLSPATEKLAGVVKANLHSVQLSL